MMRRPLAPLSLLLLAACGGASGSPEPAPVTPAPVPGPAQDQEGFNALAESADQPGGGPADAPLTAEEARSLAAIERLTASPPVAFFLPADRRVLVARAVRLEDGASEVSALLVSADGQTEEAAAWRSGSPGEEDEAAKIRRLLAAKLAGAAMVELTYTAWPAGGSSLRVARPAMTLAWRKGALSARIGGERIAIGKIRAVAPHRPRPAGVFASPDSPAALVVVRHDPAGAAAETLGVLIDVLRFEVAP